MISKSAGQRSVLASWAEFEGGGDDRAYPYNSDFGRAICFCESSTSYYLVWLVRVSVAVRDSVMIMVTIYIISCYGEGKFRDKVKLLLFLDMQFDPSNLLTIILATRLTLNTPN